MNSKGPASHPQATKLIIDCVLLEIWLKDGRVLFVPTEWYTRLKDASQAQRENFRIVADGQGIYWPELDEDLSVAGMLMPR